MLHTPAGASSPPSWPAPSAVAKECASALASKPAPTSPAPPAPPFAAAASPFAAARCARLGEGAGLALACEGAPSSSPTSCICSRYWRRSMDEGSVMLPIRSSVCATPSPPPWLPVLLPLSLRASRCHSPAPGHMHPWSFSPLLHKAARGFRAWFTLPREDLQALDMGMRIEASSQQACVAILPEVDCCWRRGLRVRTRGDALHVGGALGLGHVADVLQPPCVPPAPHVVLQQPGGSGQVTGSHSSMHNESTA